MGQDHSRISRKVHSLNAIIVAILSSGKVIYVL